MPPTSTSTFDLFAQFAPEVAVWHTRRPRHRPAPSAPLSARSSNRSSSPSRQSKLSHCPLCSPRRRCPHCQEKASPQAQLVDCCLKPTPPLVRQPERVAVLLDLDVAMHRRVNIEHICLLLGGLPLPIRHSGVGQKASCGALEG